MPAQEAERTGKSEQPEKFKTNAEKEAQLQRVGEAVDVREGSRADTISQYAGAQEKIRTLQTIAKIGEKIPKEDKGRIGSAVDVLTKAIGRTLGMAGVIAAMAGAAGVLRPQSAQAAPLEKSRVSVESTDIKLQTDVQECRALFKQSTSVDEKAGAQALTRLVEIARTDPSAFDQFLNGSYQSVDGESGRTLFTDWGLSRAEMERAVTDTNSKFRLRNTVAMLNPLLDKDADVNLLFSQKDEFLLKKYPSQAYSDKPRSTNGEIVRRDVIFPATMSGQDYQMRAAFHYANGNPDRFFVEAHQKNANPFQADSIRGISDERVAILSPEFQAEVNRYEHGEIGSRTFSEYENPGRELVSELRVLDEVTRKGLSGEADTIAKQIAQDIRRIESGMQVEKGEGQGRGFFDYSKLPELVQRELSTPPTNVDGLKEVIQTRGSMAVRQMGRDFDAAFKELLSSATEKK